MVNGGTYSFEYHLKDHLGNTRVAYSDANSDGFIDEDEILQVTDYYPFGMRHEIEGYPNHANQKYLYNGKELQEETGWYDYGARMYAPTLGRFHVPDPLADFMPGISPYSYAYNNPILYVDNFGLAPGKFGQWLRKAGLKVGSFLNMKVVRTLTGGQFYRQSKGRYAWHKDVPNRGIPGPPPEGPPSAPDDDVVVEDVEPDIEEPDLDFEDVDIPDMDPIDTRSYIERLEDDLTGGPRNLTRSFGSRPGHHDGYISKGKSGFDAYIKQIAELINQRPHIKVNVTVSTAYGEHESLTHDGGSINIYTAPGVNIVGTSNRLLKARRDYIKGALIKAGVPSSNIRTKYNFGQKDSVVIKVTK